MVIENKLRKLALSLLYELKYEANKGDKYAREFLSKFANEHSCHKHIFGAPLCNKRANHWEFAEYERKWIPICEKHAPSNLGRIVLKPDWTPEDCD